MTNVDITMPAPVAQQGAPVAAGKASPKKRATAQKDEPKARKSARRAKTKKIANTRVRPGSKSAKMLELMARTNGASLAELMKATKWQAHSVRGFLSTASRKRGVKMESHKNGEGKRIYHVKK